VTRGASAANQNGERRAALAVRRRISVSLTRENPREYADEPAHWAQARLARPCRARHGWRRPALTWMEGRADNFSLDINFVTAA